MRVPAIAAVVSAMIGCAPSHLSPQVLPPIEPAASPQAGPLIDAPTYTSKIAALRATLARSGIELDTGRVITTCTGHDTGGCVTCELASRESTAGVDPEMIDGISIAFATYPSKVLAAAKLEHVALCKTIRQTAAPDKAADPNAEKMRAPAGVAVLDDHRMLISVEHFVGVEHVYAYFTIEEVVHHELFHFLDLVRLGDKVNADAEWHALNAPEFAYGDPAPAVERPVGFVNAYATTNEVEDRASVYEYLMGQPGQLCQIAAADPIVRAKTIVVWKRVAEVTGEAVLHQHARCVDWIHARPAPPRKPAPPRPKARPAKPNLKLPTSSTTLKMR